LIKDLGFQQSLEAVRAYGLWSASLATETSKTLKEESSCYLSSVKNLRSSLSQAQIYLRTKTDDAFDTLSESFETTKDELKVSHSKCSELESKMKSLQILDKEKDKKLEGIAKELEEKDKRIYAFERSSLEEYEHGFSRVVEQFEVLHHGLDVSGVNSRFVVREGRIVDPEARSTFGVVTDRRKT
jgi:chromosome segregation ATPase